MYLATYTITYPSYLYLHVLDLFLPPPSYLYLPREPVPSHTFHSVVGHVQLNRSNNFASTPLKLGNPSQPNSFHLHPHQHCYFGRRGRRIGNSNTTRLAIPSLDGDASRVPYLLDRSRRQQIQCVDDPANSTNAIYPLPFNAPLQTRRDRVSYSLVFPSPYTCFRSYPCPYSSPPRVDPDLLIYTPVSISSPSPLTHLIRNFFSRSFHSPPLFLFTLSLIIRIKGLASCVLILANVSRIVQPHLSCITTKYTSHTFSTWSFLVYMYRRSAPNQSIL